MDFTFIFFGDIVVNVIITIPSLSLGRPPEILKKQLQGEKKTQEKEDSTEIGSPQNHFTAVQKEKIRWCCAVGFLLLFLFLGFFLFLFFLFLFFAGKE